MLERFLKKTRFDSFDDFMQHYEVCVPEHFNFAYDVVDAWAKEDADKRAMLWTNEVGEERTFTFGEMKRWSDRTASTLSIGTYPWCKPKLGSMGVRGLQSSGYRIGPFEVESTLMKHPAVLECAVTGVPDEIRGQLVKATIVLTEEYRGKADEALKRDIQHHVKETTAPYKYPRVVEFVDELPKTISGKIKHLELRQKK